MPPYPEKQSPLLVRLKQKKPLTEPEGVTESQSPPPTTGHNDDGPKLTETAVKMSKNDCFFKYFVFYFSFILINSSTNNNKMVFFYLLILPNLMVIMKNQHQNLLHLHFNQQKNSYLKTVIFYLRMI